MGRVIVVGSVNVDLVVRGERLPAPGETVVGGTFRRFHGGKGGNQAVAAARLGGQVVFVGAVGADGFGDEAIAALESDGVGTGEVVRRSGTPTGVALILVDAHGENLISVASGANAELGAAQVRAVLDRLVLRSGDIVVVGHEIDTATMRAALADARAAGAVTILNPAPADGLERSMFADVDILTPNRRELALLARGDEPAVAARALLGAGGVRRAVLISTGPSGATLVPQDGPALAIPAPRVEAVDATGAGDALNGALAAALAAGLALDEAARRAVVAASLSVSRLGAREGMPTLAELERFLVR